MAPKRSSAPRPNRKSTMIGHHFPSPQTSVLRSAASYRGQMRPLSDGTLGRKPRPITPWMA